MIGTIVNVVSIIIGSIIGLVIKGKFNSRLQEIASQATALAVIFVGLQGALSKLINEPCHPVLYVLSLVIGGVIGTIINIEGGIKRLGNWIEVKCNGSEGSVSKAFVTGSLLYCIGAMAILGAIEGGINHNYTTLYTKSIIDGLCAIIFASTLGYGIIFSAISVLIYQGLITLVAGNIQAYLTGDIMRELSLVGGILITGIGIDMLGIKKINVSNMLPAVFIPVIYYGFYYLFY